MPTGLKLVQYGVMPFIIQAIPWCLYARFYNLEDRWISQLAALLPNICSA